MSYKKYIKRDGKTFGPYVYHSKKVDGKVISEYEGKYEKKNNKKIWIFVFIGLVLFLSLFFASFSNSHTNNFQFFNSAKESFLKSFNSLTGFDVLSSNNSNETSVNNSNISNISGDVIMAIIDTNNSNQTAINETNQTIFNNETTNATFNGNNSNITSNGTINIPENQTNTTRFNITNETTFNATGNITGVNTTGFDITNETAMNETITNITEIANATISTVQLTPKIKLGEPVKWKKQINPENAGNLTVNIPKDANNIDVVKIRDNIPENITSQSTITGGVLGSQSNFFLDFINKIIGAITGKAIDENKNSNKEKEVEIKIDEPNTSYEVQYETPAPYSVEEDKSNGKTVTIVGPDTVHYDDVLAFTNLNENLGVKDSSSVKIYWVENNTFIEPSSVQDLDSNGIYDYVEWNVPHLSNQTFNIIVVTKAEHLDSNRQFISDIYDSVKTLDNVWSEAIPDEEYVRVTFEHPLDNTRDITLYPRVISGNPKIEVYENNGTNLIATFNPVNSNEYNKVLLTNLIGEQDTFDLKVVGGSIELDYIVDPSGTTCTGGVCTLQFNVSESWVVPTGVTEITGLTIGAGGGGARTTSAGGGGTGGALRYSSSIPVTPGQSLTIRVGDGGIGKTTPGGTGGYSSIANSTTTLLLAAGGGGGTTSTPAVNNGTSTTTDGVTITGGNGGIGGIGSGSASAGGGGGAGGYSGNGGDGGDAGAANPGAAGLGGGGGGGGEGGSISTAGAGGGVGILGEGTSGAGGAAGSPGVGGGGGSNGNNGTGSTGGLYGGGGGGDDTGTTAGNGKNGTVIITYSTIPKWSDNSTNGTDAGTYILHSVLWTEDVALSGYIFSFDNGTGTLVNGSFVPMTGTMNWSNVTKFVNQTGDSTIRWQVYVNDTSNNFNATDIFSYTTFVDQPPKWFNPSINDTSPFADEFLSHNINWTDDVGLSYATLELNGTGANCNTLANVSSVSLSGKFSWANLTWVIPDACEGHTIGWRQYANDSANQWNVTTLQTYLVGSIAPIASFGTNPIDNLNSSNSSITFDLKVSDNNAIDELKLYGNWTGSWIANQTNSTPINDTFWNVTVIGIPDGKYIWAAWANDTSGNSSFTTTNRTLLIDTTNPLIDYGTGVSANNSNVSRSYVFVNVSYTELNPVNITFSISNATGIWNSTTYLTSNNVSNVTINWTGLADGIYDYNATVYDLVNHANTTQLRRITLESIFPQIQFVAPTENNGTSKNQNWIFANVSVIEANFANITFILFNATGQLNSTTYTSFVNQTNWTNLNNSNVLYWYNVSVYDTAGNLNQTETRYITLISNQAPVVTIYYPTNTTYATNVSQLNFTAIDDVAVNSCWYSLNGGANSTPSASCSNFSGLTSTEGSNTWIVYANDSSNALGTNSTTFFKDTIKPNVQFVTRTTSTGNFSQSYIEANVSASDSGTGLNATLVTLYNSTGIIRSSVNTTSYNFTNFTNLADGTYSLNATANDSAGNTNQTETRTILLDTTTPLIAYGTGVSSNNTNASRTYVFVNVSYTETNPSNITFRIYNSSGNWNTTNYLTSSNASNTSINFTGLANGVYDYNVTLYDIAGNSNTTQTYRITLDTVSPTITLPVYTNATIKKNTDSLTFNISVSDSLSGVSSCSINVNGNANQTLLVSNGWCNGTYALTGLSDGNKTINAYANDTANNFALNNSYVVLIDTTAPVVTLPFYTNATIKKNTDNLTLNISVIDATTSPSVCLVNVNGTNTTISVSNGWCNSTTIPLTNLGDGNKTIFAYANDSANNLGLNSSYVVLIDSNAPVVSFGTNPIDNKNSSNSSITFDLKATDGISVKYLVLYGNWTGSWVANQTNSSPINNTFWNATVTGIPDGKYVWAGWANDSAGNSAFTTTNRTLLVDTINPLITSLTESPSDPAIYSPATIYVFNATITDTNLNVTLINFDGVNRTPTGNGNIYNYTTSNLSAGVHSYYWYANDTAGNVNQTAIQTYTVNNATGDIVLLINGSAQDQTGNYGIQTNASATTLYGTVTLLRNGTDVTSQNKLYVTLAVGYYNYTATSSGDQNHSSALTSLFVTISKSQSNVNLSVNGTRGNITIFQDSTIPINLSIITGDSGNVLLLYNNGTLINQGSSPLGNFTTFSQIGLFNITGIHIDSQNFTADSETWWVNVSQTPDVTNPVVTSLTEFPTDPATYSLGATYQFNATITDNRQLSTVLINFSGTNYTVSNFSGNVYNFTISDLATGTYNYRWFANDTSGNVNNTQNATYTVNQAITALNLTITPSTSVTYGTQTTATGTGCPSQINCTLYRNNTLVSNPDIVTLGSGVYNYTYNTTGNTNYTSYTNTTSLLINQAAGLVFTYINNVRANKTIEQFSVIYLNGTLVNGTGNIKLYDNGTLINQGTSPLSNLTNFSITGLYNITTIYDGNTNYTGASETWWLNVSPVDTISPQINITYPLNKTYNAIQTQLNYTASDNIGLAFCWYSLDGGATNSTPSAACQNITGLTSVEGFNNWTVYANDSRGNKNSSSLTFFVDSINPTISLVSPTENNNTALARNYIQVNASASDANLNTITIRLFNSSGQVRINSSLTNPFFINYTGLSAGNYFFNATANDTVNNQNSTETRNVSIVTPTINITNPGNKTYITIQNLNLNFTALNYDNIAFNLDGGANTTITANTTFNTTNGVHTLYLFANNSVGTTVKNITFTANTTKFIVIYNNFSNQGSTTNFNSSSYEDLQNLSGIILEEANYGKIKFNDAINVTNDSTPSDNRADLDDNIVISSNFIYLNSTALPNFNKSANLFLYNLTFSNPRILRDGALCPVEICTQQSYTSGTLVFTVTQFSNYSAEETPAGAAESTSPSAGGGGNIPQVECIDDSQCTGGKVCWENKCVQLFDVKILDFSSPVKLGDFFGFTYYIKGQADINNDVIVNFWIQNQNRSQVTTGSDTIYMGNFDEKTETTKMFLPTTLESGVYDFYVQVHFKNYEAESHRTIQIEVKNGVATITNAGPNITLYIILGSILLILTLFFIIFLRRRTRRYEKPVLKRPVEIIKPTIKREELPPVEKMVHEKRYILRKIFAKVKVAFLNVKYKFTSIRARYKARRLSKQKAKERIARNIPQVERITPNIPQIQKIVPKKIAQAEPEFHEKGHLLYDISEKAKVVLLRIKYWFTSLKPKYEAGIYKKEISEIESLPGKIFKPIKSEIEKINVKRQGQIPQKRESIKLKKEIPIIKPQIKKVITRKPEPIKPNKGPKKGPKTVGEIIEELREESEKEK